MAEAAFFAPFFFNWLTVFFAREETQVARLAAVFLAFFTPVLAAVLVCLAPVGCLSRRALYRFFFRHRLRQGTDHEVFRNLITNAVKYNDKKYPVVEVGFLESLEAPHGPRAKCILRQG